MKRKEREGKEMKRKEKKKKGSGRECKKRKRNEKDGKERKTYSVCLHACGVRAITLNFVRSSICGLWSVISLRTNKGIFRAIGDWCADFL